MEHNNTTPYPQASEKNKADTESRIFQIYSSIASEHLFRYDIREDSVKLFTLNPNGQPAEYTIESFLKFYHENDDFIDPRDKTSFIRTLKSASITPTSGRCEFRSSYFCKNKCLCWYRTEFSSQNDESGSVRYISGRISNIDSEKKTIENIRQEAQLDSLTKMYSYELFCCHVTELIENAGMTDGKLIYVDITNYDSLGSKLGYDYTDVLVRSFAKNLKAFYGERYIIGRVKNCFLLFTKKTTDSSLIKSDCNGIIGFAENVVSDDAAVSIEARIGTAYYPQDSDNIKGLVSIAEIDADYDKSLHVTGLHHEDDDIIEGNVADISGIVPKSENNSISDMLIGFINTLFYNIKTRDVSQKAFDIISDYLSICRVTLQTTTGGKKDPIITLYENGDAISDITPYEEQHFYATSGNIVIYRIYRREGSQPYSPYQQKMLGVVFNITHTYSNRYASMRTSKFAKSHDMNFGCLNSMGFNKILKDYNKNGIDLSNYAALFLNVKEYKNINTKVGFENGNAVIHAIVDFFNKNLEGHELFCRSGGDNFSLLLDKKNLGKKIEMLSNIPCEITMNDDKFNFSISFRIGVYLIESELVDIPEIMENASIAYSFTRQPGKGDVIFYSEEKRESYEHRKYIINALEPALENGEFLVYFQPKVNIDNYTIIGAEALSRWKRNGAIMPPGTFIPIFVETGLISKIDFYVFEYVCKTLRKWIDEGIEPVTISVNFEKASLEFPEFAKRLSSIAEKYNAPIEYLEIEFTESSCMENESKFNDILAELKECGFHASLDDFGRGYSSINMLNNMNFDILKLDKSFLSEEKLSSERSKIILKSVIGMAQSLEIDVISEGVETIEQINCLKMLKCKTVQGYYFDKPLPEEIFRERLCTRKYNFSECGGK